MKTISDWRKKDTDCGESKGKVLALSHPFHNLIRPANVIWPPPEIIQKMYKSRQVKSFTGDDYDIVTKRLGYYCDLQSLHSEEAITWSVFGPVKYASQDKRVSFVKELLAMLDSDDANISDAHMWLWRRLPHPDTLTPGGPEIDFGIVTDDIVVLGEGKWLSGVGKKQGKNKTKDQITLRIEFAKKYGARTFGHNKSFIILFLSLTDENEIVNAPGYPDTGSITSLQNLTWEAVCHLKSHPCSDELIKYYQWKMNHSGQGEH